MCAPTTLTRTCVLGCLARRIKNAHCLLGRQVYALHGTAVRCTALCRGVGAQRSGGQRGGAGSKPRKGGAPERWGLRRVGARKGGATEGGRPNISRSVFPLPLQMSLFCFALWGLLVELWLGFEAVDHPKQRVWAPWGHCVKSGRLVGRRGSGGPGEGGPEAVGGEGLGEGGPGEKVWRRRSGGGRSGREKNTKFNNKSVNSRFLDILYGQNVSNFGWERRTHEVFLSRCAHHVSSQEHTVLCTR